MQRNPMSSTEAQTFKQISEVWTRANTLEERETVHNRLRELAHTPLTTMVTDADLCQLLEPWLSLLHSDPTAAGHVWATLFQNQPNTQILAEAAIQNCVSRFANGPQNQNLPTLLLKLPPIQPIAHHLQTRPADLPALGGEATLSHYQNVIQPGKFLRQLDKDFPIQLAIKLPRTGPWKKAARNALTKNATTNTATRRSRILLSYPEAWDLLSPKEKISLWHSQYINKPLEEIPTPTLLDWVVTNCLTCVRQNNGTAILVSDAAKQRCAHDNNRWRDHQINHQYALANNCIWADRAIVAVRTGNNTAFVLPPTNAYRIPLQPTVPQFLTLIGFQTTTFDEGDYRRPHYHQGSNPEAILRAEAHCYFADGHADWITKAIQLDNVAHTIDTRSTREFCQNLARQAGDIAGQELATRISANIEIHNDWLARYRVLTNDHPDLKIDLPPDLIKTLL